MQPTTPILICITPTHTSVTARGHEVTSGPRATLRQAVSRALACEDGPFSHVEPPVACEGTGEAWMDLDDDLELLSGLNLGGA